MKYLYAAAGFIAGYAAFTAVSWLAVHHLTTSPKWHSTWSHH